MGITSALNTSGAVRGYGRAGYGNVWHLINVDPSRRLCHDAAQQAYVVAGGLVSMCGCSVETYTQLAVNNDKRVCPVPLDGLAALPICPRCNATSVKRYPQIMRNVVAPGAWRDAGLTLLDLLARLDRLAPAAEPVAYPDDNRRNLCRR